MRPYHPPLEGRRRGLRLDFNENTVGPPPGVLRALAALDADDIAMYPEYGPARAAIARSFGVSQSELILTNGTDDAIHLLVDGFANPGDEVLVVEPSYAMYRFYAERAGARIRAVRAAPAAGFPSERVVAELRRGPRLALLASPNNPTGAVIPADALRRVLDAAPGTVVFVDEAYFEFCGQSALGWIRRRRNLVVARTFSKARGLAGLRLGCLLANAQLITALARAHSPYSVGTAALAAGLAALRDAAATRRYAAEVVRARGHLEEALDGLGIRRFPSGGNFVLVDVGPRARRLVAGLARRGILVRDRRRDFGRTGYVRITVGSLAQTRRLIRDLEALWRRG
jgi:histidinol-phosphate aminotransferase